MPPLNPAHTHTHTHIHSLTLTHTQQTSVANKTARGKKDKFENVHGHSGAHSDCTRWSCSVPPADVSLPITACVLCCYELSRDISDSVKIRKWNLVDCVLCAVWRAERRMFSPPDSCFVRLFFAENGGLWIILRGKNCVISLLCHRRPSVHIMKCMIQLFDIFLFTFLSQAASHSCSSRNSAPPLFFFSSPPPFPW